MTYATLFNEHEMKFSNFRHMWLYALQSRIDQGPNTVSSMLLFFSFEFYFFKFTRKTILIIRYLVIS